MLRLLPFGLALCGCTKAQYAEEVSSPAGADDTADPAGGPGSSGESPWTASEVEEELNQALSRRWPAPTTIRNAYLSAMSHGDGSCPGSTVELTNPITAMQGCTASSGWSYQGHSTYSATGTVGQDNSANWWISADFQIENPDDEALIGGGGVMLSYRKTPSDTSEYVVELYGTWMDESRSDWLGEGISAVLTTQVTETSTTPRVSIDGGLTAMDTSFHFRDLTLNGEACSGPSGTIGIHDQTSKWYWVDLDCSPCGPLRHDDQAMGEACLEIDDLADTILDAVSRP